MTLNEYIDSIKDRRISVLGLGVSNMPLIRALLAKGCHVTAHDKTERAAIAEKADELEKLGAKLRLGEDYLENIDGEIIFRTPGLHPDTPGIKKAVSAGAELTSEMELFFKVCPCRIIAITGSDGKTTTTTITSELLKAAGYNVHLGGNIGKPLLTEADSYGEKDIAVLELSSFQLITMCCAPNVAVITNLAPNHLDIHKDMDEYVNSKKNIFKGQCADDVLVLNLDNDITASFIPEAAAQVRTFSRKQAVARGAHCLDGSIYLDGEYLMDASEIFIPGVHNIENYLAAFSAVDGLVPREVMVRIAKEFKGVEHRIEHVRCHKGVDYYNDSIASSPSRTIAGLNSFDKKLILIAGGKDKGVPFDSLGDVIIDKVKLLVLTGAAKDKIRSALENNPCYAGQPPIVEYEDFRDAVLGAANAARPGDAVILSPACTSFDRFKNFAERGNTFKNIIMELD